MLICKEFDMTTKILTVRVPSPLYSSLCQAAGELGVPVGAHLRRLLERENDSQQLAALRIELLERMDRLAVPSLPSTTAGTMETLLLCRAIGAHLNPQLVAQVRARLTLAQEGRAAP